VGCGRRCSPATVACNPSVVLQAIIGLDTAGSAHGERLRREPLNIPAGHSTRPTAGAAVRVGSAPLAEVLARLRALPTAAWPTRSTKPEEP
jgi:hypothetical protein